MFIKKNTESLPFNNIIIEFGAHPLLFPIKWPYIYQLRVVPKKKKKVKSNIY